MMMAPQARGGLAGGSGRRWCRGTSVDAWCDATACGHEPERPMKPFHFKQPMFQHDFLQNLNCNFEKYMKDRMETREGGVSRSR
jgi:hypothetical protein